MAIFVRALTGFHGVRARWALLALILALLATGLFFGLVDPPGRYGLHLVIGRLLPGGGRSFVPAWAPF